MHFSRSCSAALIALVAAVLPAQDTPAPAVPAGGIVVGTVDIAQAFNSYPRTAKERARLQKLGDGFQAQVVRVGQRIEELKASVEMYAEGTPERSQKELERELALVESRGLGKMLEAQLDLETMRSQLSIYQDIDAAIARLAKDRGVHVVLRDESRDVAPPENGATTPRVVRSRINAYERRQMWFASKQLDLTQDLIRLLQVWPLDGEKGEKAAPAAGDPPAVPPADEKPKHEGGG